nr:DUF1294 domain-containing protein [Virgibacillus sp. MSP4-1]
MGWDKRKSKKGKWRISETRLFVIAIIGGALGSTMGMYVFHHKTKKWKFKVGFPLLTFLVLTVLLFLTTLS